MKIRYASLLAAALLLGVGACSSDDDPASSEDAVDDPADEDGGDRVDIVDIVDNAFEPAELQVSAGDTVDWENTGAVAHTVTFDDEDSGELQPGDTFSRTFDEAGDFGYVCSIHPTMEATVTVTG